MCEACDAKRQQLQGERTVTSRGESGGSGRCGVGGGAGDPQDNNSLRRLGECRHCRAFSFSGSNLILNGD